MRFTHTLMSERWVLLPLELATWQETLIDLCYSGYGSKDWQILFFWFTHTWINDLRVLPPLRINKKEEPMIKRVAIQVMDLCIGRFCCFDSPSCFSVSRPFPLLE